MLDQRIGDTIIVHACLQCGQRVKSMLSTDGNGVLLGREAVGNLSSNHCVAQRVHDVVVRRIQFVTFVIPYKTKHKDQSKPSNKTACMWFNNGGNLQSKGSNQIVLSEAETSIEMLEITRLGVEGHISTKSQDVVSNHTGEVDNGASCQTNTGADTSIVVQILELNLFLTQKQRLLLHRFIHSKTIL